MSLPTRFYSNKQEKHIAKKVNGRQTANSGATRFSKGDVTTDNWLFEAKTKIKPSDSFSIKKEWFKKNREEAFAMNKDYNAVVIDFGDGEQFYMVDERTFLEMKEALENQ